MEEINKSQIPVFSSDSDSDLCDEDNQNKVDKLLEENENMKRIILQRDEQIKFFTITKKMKDKIRAQGIIKTVVITILI